MPRDELVGDSASHILNGEARCFLTPDLSVEDHLEQQITELLAKMILIGDLDSLDCLSGLLDQILDQRPVSLLSIPWAFLAQSRHNANKSLKLG
jgi:hypothetical protein